MKNNLEYKNSRKLLIFNQFLRWAEDTPSSLVDFCEEAVKEATEFLQNNIMFKVSFVDGKHRAEVIGVSYKTFNKIL